MNKWSLDIQEFGKIKNASIEVSPFMIFVGDNNSGKSYIMELLWAIIKEADQIVNSLKSIPEYNDYLIEQVEPNFPTKISAEVQKELLNFFNKALEIKKVEFIKQIFNYDLNASNIRIKRNEYPNIHFETSLEKRAVVLDTNLEENDIEQYIKTSIFVDNDKISSFMVRQIDGNIIPAERILHLVYTRVILYLIRKDYYKMYTTNPFRSLSQSREPLYLPASRTGFMLTYRAIIGNQRANANDLDEVDLEITDRHQNFQIAGTNLTLPTILYLEKLQKLNLDNDNMSIYQEEIKFLSENILEGNVHKDSFEQYEFVPKEAGKGIPLHVTSSLVSELAPIVMFLNSSFDPDLWIIEEIESHLHPKIQLEVARFLVRLFNKQKSIWITTHSDSLMQKINNLITLSSRNDKGRILEALEYSKDDIFQNVEEISAYQFQTNNGTTCVEKLELESYGFEISSFNSTLEKLILETSEIQNLSLGENEA